MSMQILYEYDIYMYQEFNIRVLQGYVLEPQSQYLQSLNNNIRVFFAICTFLMLCILKNGLSHNLYAIDLILGKVNQHDL